MNPFVARMVDGTVELIGDVDLDASEELHQVLAEAARTSEKTLAVDLSGVTFIDSSGLRELSIALRYGPEVRLIGVDSGVRKVLEVTGLDLVFKVDYLDP